MKKLLLQAVAISLLLILSCKSKNERSFYLCTFSVIFSDSDVQSKEEILYTSAGEYSPRPDDINEIRVPLYESVLYLDGKILKGRIHHFPMSDSIEFIVDKETYKPKDYIAVINNAEKENLHFSILGNSDFENISVKYISEYDYHYNYRIEYGMESRISFDTLFLKNTEFIIQ